MRNWRKTLSWKQELKEFKPGARVRVHRKPNPGGSQGSISNYDTYGIYDDMEGVIASRFEHFENAWNVRFSLNKFVALWEWDLDLI
jgi:hypothetical protein